MSCLLRTGKCFEISSWFILIKFGVNKWIQLHSSYGSGLVFHISNQDWIWIRIHLYHLMIGSPSLHDPSYLCYIKLVVKLLQWDIVDSWRVIKDFMVICVGGSINEWRRSWTPFKNRSSGIRSFKSSFKVNPAAWWGNLTLYFHNSYLMEET